MKDATSHMMDVAAQRRHERNMLRREVALVRAYTIARHTVTKGREHIPLTLQLWELFSPSGR